MNIIYSKKQFNIYNAGKGYIVHNTDKPFVNGHTHISNYNTAKFIIDLCLNNSKPNHLSKYLLVSLTRISTNDKYINDINLLLENKNNRKQSYRNTRM